MCWAWCQALGIQWRASPVTVLEGRTVGVTNEKPGHEHRMKRADARGTPQTTGSSKEERDLARQYGQASWRRGTSKLRSND